MLTKWLKRLKYLNQSTGNPSVAKIFIWRLMKIIEHSNQHNYPDSQLDRSYFDEEILKFLLLPVLFDDRQFADHLVSYGSVALRALEKFGTFKE